MHAHKLGHSNAIVLAMDSELAAEMKSRKIPVYDNSRNANDWNNTCLQRHIQVILVLYSILISCYHPHSIGDVSKFGRKIPVYDNSRNTNACISPVCKGTSR